MISFPLILACPGTQFSPTACQVEISRTYLLAHSSTLKMEEVGSVKILSIYQTTWDYIPKDATLQQYMFYVLLSFMYLERSMNDKPN